MSEALVGLIPAAGKGLRARPYTEATPKCLLEINGVPNIERNIAIMRDALGIRKIYVVIGYLGERIREVLGDGAHLGVELLYIENRNLERGLAHSILLAKEHIHDHFCVILSDECYVGSNHAALRDFPYQRAVATCATLRVDDLELIHQNYAVQREGERVRHLVEKPVELSNDLLGTGTFVFGPKIFPALEEAFARAAGRGVELIDVIDDLARRGEEVLSFELEATYVNINDRDSLNRAKYYERRDHFAEARRSLLIYSEGDEREIVFALDRYRSLDEVDDVFVILRQENQLAETVREAGVQTILCPPDVVRYGEMLKYGLDHAPGDILIIADADYSFPRRDVSKMLAYLCEADMVVGTRTTRQLIEQGSNMRGAVRIANTLLAKLMEVLWWSKEGRFTDAGCLFRAIWRSSYEGVQHELRCPGAGFGAELTVELLRRRERVIEIPVNYVNRLHSSYRKYQNWRTFFSILGTLLDKRLRHALRRPERGDAPRDPALRRPVPRDPALRRQAPPDRNGA